MTRAERSGLVLIGISLGATIGGLIAVVVTALDRRTRS